MASSTSGGPSNAAHTARATTSCSCRSLAPQAAGSSGASDAAMVPASASTSTRSSSWASRRSGDAPNQRPCTGVATRATIACGWASMPRRNRSTARCSPNGAVSTRERTTFSSSPWRKRCTAVPTVARNAASVVGGRDPAPGRPVPVQLHSSSMSGASSPNESSTSLRMKGTRSGSRWYGPTRKAPFSSHNRDPSRVSSSGVRWAHSSGAQPGTRKAAKVSPADTQRCKASPSAFRALMDVWG